MTVATLAIIVVNWNTCDLLARCLTSVFNYPPRCDFDVWVVDNASSDGSVEMVRRAFPQVKLIVNAENVGFARANNQAFRASESELVLLLNSDTVIGENALSQLVDFMQAHPHVGAAGPKLLNPDGTFQASYAQFPSLVSELLLFTGLARWITGPYAPSPRPRPDESDRAVDWVAGAAIMMRRSAVAAADVMDEDYFLYSEETDLCWRLWQSGYSVWYIPHVHIIHQGGGSSRQASVKSYCHLYVSKIRFFEKAYGDSAARRLRAMFISVAYLRSLLWQTLLLFFSSSAAASLYRRLEQDHALINSLPAHELGRAKP